MSNFTTLFPTLAEQKAALASLKQAIAETKAATKAAKEAAKQERLAKSIARTEARLQKLLSAQVGKVGSKAIKASRKPSKAVVLKGAEAAAALTQ